MMDRHLLVRLHRYVGLTIAAFVVVAGLTGSAIAFRDELDAWLNPELFSVASRGVPLPTAEIVARVERSDPRIQVQFIPLRAEPGEAHQISVAPRFDPATHRPFTLDYNQMFVDPVTGAILGHRMYGACCFARANLIPFLFRVHNNLFLPGRWGNWLMGGVALLWTIDCFVAIALTFPRSKPFLTRWRQAWLVRQGTNAQRLVLDSHRAGGLWFWCILLVLAFTGVSLNLNDELMRPAVSAFSALTPSKREQAMARFRLPPPPPILTLDDAVARAEQEAARRGWPMTAFEAGYLAAFRVYFVNLAKGDGDPDAGLGHPVIYLDSQTGDVVRVDKPGEGSAGDVFLQWQLPLHSGEIIGLPGRIIICLSGLAAAGLAAFGVVIWWRKRRARQQRARWAADGASRPSPIEAS